MSIYHDRRLLIPFRSTLLPQIFTDTLVIGTGVAGLRACVEAARHGDVILLAKEAVDLSNTSWAQGGIAAVLSGTDTLRSHVEDTLEAGAGLCERTAVEALVAEGAEEVAQLMESLGTGVVIVLDGPLLLGTVSERDLALASPQADTPVAALLPPSPGPCCEDDFVADVTSRMRRLGLSCLAVASADGRISGALSRTAAEAALQLRQGTD